MAKIKINTAKKTVPMIYAYTTPEIRRHDGWTKIGYTEQDVDTRINQQTHTADVKWHKEWQGTAIFDDGTGDCFKDKDFHAYLRKNDIKNENGEDNEWFHITGTESKDMFYDFKANRGFVRSNKNAVVSYRLRQEQEEAVTKAIDYFKLHEEGVFLWNAKPRFGKTLATYDLCKRMGARKVLIVTNRPAIANSWYSDYAEFFGAESGYIFVSNVDALKDKSLVVTRDHYLTLQEQKDPDDWDGCIEFVSLQDLKGSKYFGGDHDKLREVADIEWDILVIDEAHEGVYTGKTDIAFNHIKRKSTLHLSGTPFKALANDVFASDAIYNWTYADEQKMKRTFVPEEGSDNPYDKLPQLNMYTYQMSEIIKEDVKQGVEIDGETVEYAFDLNEFFATNENGKFTHNEAVNRFLDAMVTQEKFPFSTDELRNELKHTVWLLNRVDSAKALARKLKNHPVFKEYEVILAAGDGRLDNDGREVRKAFDRVKEAIRRCDKTITLTVGQLTTGITVPEWTAILMLSSIQSPALYMQAAFRSQNPCLFTNGKEYFRKKNSYVFDFDPARTLIIFEKFANDLSEDTANGKGNTELRKEHVKELLNFFPVIGEDENGEMMELDAEKVLSIPRKIKSKEVVKRGFMSNFLFQNISNVFNAPQEVIDIITAISPAKEEPPLTTSTGDELSINKEGDVELSNEKVIGISSQIFGEKVYEEAAGSVEETIETVAEEVASGKGKDSVYDKLTSQILSDYKEKVTDSVLKTATDNYGNDFRKSKQNELERRINADAEIEINRAVGDFKIKQNTLNADEERAIDAAKTKEEVKEIKKTFEEKRQSVMEDFQSGLKKSVEELAKKAENDVVRTIETDKRDAKKRTIEDKVRDHLRGFSRTIPSFLMAYGENDNIITLATFDGIVPDEVFKEVTSITLDNFRFLRDGGDYQDPDTGENRHFDGKLFDPIVFDDSVKEFLVLKKRLADYFDEASTEDIFDYIPPQRTNQIFTPRKIVKNMTDMLERESPGCFDDPDHTFADLYMKSGMYITEIVKRLYQSPKMKALYPDDKERLSHIFSEQVYGCAPTEIIYRIALAYILGFSDDIEIKKHNIKLCDTLKYAKEGTLDEILSELFPELASDEK